MLVRGEFFEAGGSINHAENYIKKYLPKDLLDSGKVKFLRTENFESDFTSIFKDFIDLGKIPAQEFDLFANMSRQALSQEIRLQLWERRDEIYANCPYWAEVEKLAYPSSQVLIDVVKPTFVPSLPLSTRFKRPFSRWKEILKERIEFFS